MPSGIAGASLPAPVYPELSRRLGEQGLVKLAVEVSPDGTIGQITVVNDPGYPRLVEAAIQAVRSRRQLPPVKEDGKPVYAVVYIPFNFTLR